MTQRSWLQKLFNKVLRKLGEFGVVVDIVPKPDRKLVSLKPSGTPVGAVLVSYVVEPFLLPPGSPVSNAHSEYWESLQIARTFLDLGFAVDVVSYRNRFFRPRKPYTYFVGSRTNFARIAQHLNPDCVKVAHLDTAHWLYNNKSAYHRALKLAKRRGISVRSFRTIEPNRAIEECDLATVLGNQFTIDSYAFAHKPIYRIPISTAATFSAPDQKDFEFARRRFIWFGSSGLVHKGLDVVLEAFAQLPDYHLTVCGPIEAQRELEFREEYRRELYELPNVHTAGWVDVESSEFREILNSSLGIVFPSCSEGGGGSAVLCMQAGLIPIVTPSASVDAGDFGIVLPRASIREIKDAIVHIAELPIDELERRAMSAWQLAQRQHTRQAFEKNYREFVRQILLTGAYKSPPAAHAGGTATILRSQSATDSSG